MSNRTVSILVAGAFAAALGSLAATACVRGLASGPILERRTDRECAREAVGLLVGERSRRRRRLGEASMPVVGARRTAIAVITERDEGTGRGPVHAGQRSLRHPGDDTRPTAADVRTTRRWSG